MKGNTVHADVKFHSQMPFTNVDVCFRDRSELQDFIAALQLLLTADKQAPGLTLADPASYLPDAPEPTQESLATSVTFHPPGHVRDELDLRCLASARSHLESLLDDEEGLGNAV